MIETKGRKSYLVDISEFYKLVRLDITKVKEDRRVGRLHGRLAGLGLGDICGRCGGSGHYSFNQMDGTRCYGCNGNRTLMPKLSEAFYERVKEVVEGGQLDAYLEKLNQRARVENAEKTLRVFVSKSQIAADYSAEYDRNRGEENAERRRVDALAGGQAMGDFFKQHHNKANIKPMDETVKSFRFAQTALEKEYETLLHKLMRERGYGNVRRPQTDEDRQACEALLLEKYEDVKARLEAQEAAYVAGKHE